MLIIVVVLLLLSSFMYRIDVLCLNSLKNATFDHRGCSVMKLHIGQEQENCFMSLINTLGQLCLVAE